MSMLNKNNEADINIESNFQKYLIKYKVYCSDIERQTLYRLINILSDVS